VQPAEEEENGKTGFNQKACCRECVVQAIAFDGRIEYDKVPKSSVKSSKGFSRYECIYHSRYYFNHPRRSYEVLHHRRK
jgi:hypothetical protein